MELPPYTYIPGGPHPHPNRTRRAPSPPPPPIPGDGLDWHRSPTYLLGVQLWNSGFYWEAHEAWEALWHAHQRTGPTADLLKALIKLAAAGVKARQGQLRGVETHARRAAALLRQVSRSTEPAQWLGLDLPRLASWADLLLLELSSPPPPLDAPPHPVFRHSLHPVRFNPPIA